LGYALKLLNWKRIEGEAQNQLSLAYGTAEPCLTTAGKAENKSPPQYSPAFRYILNLLEAVV